MNVLKMKKGELYEVCLRSLTEKLGAPEVLRFIGQCKPRYSRLYYLRRPKYKLLENQQDVDTTVKRLQDTRAETEIEDSAGTEITAASQNEMKKMTDLEIYEIGGRVLINKVGVTGLTTFIKFCYQLTDDLPIRYIQDRETIDEFIELYTVGLKFYPKIVEGYIKRGNTYHRIWEFDKAIEDYSRAIKIKPDSAEAYYYRGNIYRDMSGFDEAIMDYTKSIEIVPNSAEVHYARGVIYAMDDVDDKAIADFSEAIRLDPEHIYAHSFRGTVYKSHGQYDKTIRDFSSRLELEPDDPEMYSERADVYVLNGESDKAIEDFSKVLDLFPDDADTYAKRAEAYFVVGKLAYAIQDYDRVLELEPKLTYIYAKRGIVWLHLKEWDNAKLDLNFARHSRIDIAETFHSLYENLAEFEARNDAALPVDIAAMLRRQ